MSQYKIAAIAGQYLGNQAEQQDRVTLIEAPRAPGFMMAVLADGDGGPVKGAKAAEQVIQTATQLFGEFSPVATTPPVYGARKFDTDLDKLDAMLHDLVDEAHTAIKLGTQVAETEAHSSLTVLVLTPQGDAIWAVVGDARLYRFGGEALADKSNDRGYIAHLLAEGVLTLAAAKNHRLSPLLINALGNTKRTPYATVARHTGLKAGDAFLLCTTGLWHYFSDEEFGAVIARLEPRIASEKLIAKATQRADGKGDNCTFVIIKLVAHEAAAPKVATRKLDSAV